MIEKITNISGKGIPVRGNDIDTDRIIPARFMKCLTFNGLGQFAFYDARFEEDGSEKDHPLNNKEYDGHSILITNRNFGCGSSREHAPWALYGIGIKCIIAQSYAEIFAGNCSSLGIAALIVSEEDSHSIQSYIENTPQASIDVDIALKTIQVDQQVFSFNMPETYRLALLDGKWDTTSMLLEGMDVIKDKHNDLPKMKMG